MSDSTEPKVDATVKPAEGEEKPVTSSSVFSMFGGGAKKEKKDDEEDRGDNSGSAKAQRDAAAAKKGDDEVSISCHFLTRKDAPRHLGLRDLHAWTRDG